MSNYAHSSGVFHLPQLYSRRGMEIFKERVRTKVQPHNKNDVWFQNQYENYLNLVKSYQAYGTPIGGWRFEIVQNGRHDSLQIPCNFFAGQQQQNNFAPAASLQAAQPGCHLTTGSIDGNANIQNPQLNPSISQYDGYFAPTTCGYTDTPSVQFDPKVFQYGGYCAPTTYGYTDPQSSQLAPNADPFRPSSVLNPHAQMFNPGQASTNSRAAAGRSYSAGAAVGADPRSIPFTETVTFESSSGHQGQSTQSTPSVRLSQATNNFGTPAGLSSSAQGKQPATNADIPTKPPPSSFGAFAAEQRRLNLIPPQVEAGQARRYTAPAAPFGHSPVCSHSASPQPRSEQFTTQYDRGQLHPCQNQDGTWMKHIPPHAFIRKQNPRSSDLRKTSEDSIDSGYDSKSSSRAQLAHIITPNTRSFKVTDTLPGLEKKIRRLSKELAGSTVTKRRTPPAPPAASNRVQVALANVLEDFRVMDVESARALLREKGLWAADAHIQKLKYARLNNPRLRPTRLDWTVPEFTLEKSSSSHPTPVDLSLHNPLQGSYRPHWRDNEEKFGNRRYNLPLPASWSSNSQSPQSRPHQRNEPGEMDERSARETGHYLLQLS
ncbi:hypothetical protein ABVK25_004364 [Lepraria finkii]|uniref:Uncharacterized protein n=1 Tax=Lepraria finkii TaxID=1340010 RepID=A0ABR4BCH7_9LECA